MEFSQTKSDQQVGAKSFTPNTDFYFTFFFYVTGTGLNRFRKEKLYSYRPTYFAAGVGLKLKTALD
jgi:hypothetical protein